MRIHELKTIEPYFSDIARGEKTFEIRKADRDFKEGDILHLRKWSPGTEYGSGRELIARVAYLIPEGQFEGIAPGYCAMGIELLGCDL